MGLIYMNFVCCLAGMPWQAMQHFLLCTKIWDNAQRYVFKSNT